MAADDSHSGEESGGACVRGWYTKTAVIGQKIGRSLTMSAGTQCTHARPPSRAAGSHASATQSTSIAAVRA